MGAAKGARVRLLVVEDDVDLNRQLVAALTEAGYAVDKAFDGEEGHFLGETEPYDAIVLDIGLPKLNGYEVARKIREQPWGQDMVLVALTGWGQEEDRQKSKDAGFNAHLVKPVEQSVLIKLLAEL